jgi:hypothetical protein
MLFSFGQDCKLSKIYLSPPFHFFSFSSCIYIIWFSIIDHYLSQIFHVKRKGIKHIGLNERGNLLNYFNIYNIITNLTCVKCVFNA